MAKTQTKFSMLLVLGSLMAVPFAALISLKPVNAAACAAPATTYGTVTASITAPAAETYRVWSRIMPADAANNSYLLEIDGANCFTVGGASTSLTDWTWVDYKDGSSASKIQLALSQGVHTFKMIGSKPGFKIDHIIITSDLNCTPTGSGDNCNTPADTTPPTVTLASPAQSTTIVSGNVQLAATASDASGIGKVEFYANSALLASTTTTPYQYTWNTATSQNGTYVLTARAYDKLGNVASDSTTVTVQNGDTQAPTTPGSVTAAATAYNNVTLSWQASTDNIAVTGYRITRNNSHLVTLASTATTYNDAAVLPGTQYTYTVVAFDAAGNTSAASAAVSATTPTVPDTQAPSVPAQIQAAAVSSSQINLSWAPSTDNIAVAAYDVYRAPKGGTAAKVASVTTTDFGDTHLDANREYTYFVRARDAAGNTSAQSASVNATTKATTSTKKVIRGQVTNQRTGRAIRGARVTISQDGERVDRVSTDSNGRYRIRLSNISGDELFTLTYRASGYATKTFSLRLGSDVTSRDVALTKTNN